MVDLRVQEADRELHSGVLDLLPAFNYGERRRKMVRRWWLGF
jgi:hypothetical protein